MKWRVLLWCLLLLSLGAAWVWQGSQRAPAWYTPPDPTDIAVVQMGETVEYGVVESFHKIRPPEDTWKLRVSDGQINAWLATRLPGWLSHGGQEAWPIDLGLPQVHIGEHGIDVALPASVGEGTQLLVSRLAPRVVDGRVQVDVDRVGVGSIAVPGASAASLVELIDRIVPAEDAEADLVRKVVDLLAGRAQMDAVLPLSDGRRVELLDLAFVDGAIELTNRTLPDTP